MAPHLLRLLVIATLVSTPAAFADGPSDLLKQAIRENEHRDQTGPARAADPEIDALENEAKQLADQGQFKEAVRLYEQAYRLNPDNRAMYARLLVAKRAAGLMTEQDREALSLIEEEHAAEMNQVFRRVRVQIIQARQAIRSGDLALASQRVEASKAALAQLPDDVDVAPYERELITLTNSIKRKSNRTAKSQPKKPAVSASGSDLTVTRRTGGDHDELSLMDTGEEEVVHYHETSSSDGSNYSKHYVETGEIIEIDEALYCDQAIHAYERQLAACLARRRAEHLIDNQVAAFPLPVNEDMAYPCDWTEKTAKRAEYRDGVIHRGASFTGDDGQTYETVIYDLAELVHPVPNFYAAYPGTAREQRFQSLDRQYIRERSMIFNGWPEDLAAGLPLLHFFGPIDNNAVSTRTDPYETQRIVDTIDRFIRSHESRPATTQGEPN